MRNTFVNAQMGPLANFKLPKNHQPKVNCLKWIDEVDKTRKGKDSLKANDFKNDLLKKSKADIK